MKKITGYNFGERVRIELVVCPKPHCNTCKLKKCVNRQRAVKLLEDVTYYFPDGSRLVIKKGFVFDGASIPKVAWSIIGHPLSHWFIRAALLHDALYAAEIFDRKKRDLIFLEFMEEFDCVGWIRRNLMYKAVDWFGGSVWKAHKPDMIKLSRKRVNYYTSLEAEALTPLPCPA